MAKYFHCIPQFVARKLYGIPEITENYLEDCISFLNISSISTCAKQIIQRHRAPPVNRAESRSCIIWGGGRLGRSRLRSGYTVYLKADCVVSCILFSLSLTLAASEGRVNGGEDFFQKVSAGACASTPLALSVVGSW